MPVRCEAVCRSLLSLRPLTCEMGSGTVLPSAGCLGDRWDHAPEILSTMPARCLEMLAITNISLFWMQVSGTQCVQERPFLGGRTTWKARAETAALAGTKGQWGEDAGPEASFFLGQPRARNCLWTLVQSYELHLHFSKGTATFL